MHLNTSTLNNLALCIHCPPYQRPSKVAVHIKLHAMSIIATKYGAISTFMSLPTFPSRRKLMLTHCIRLCHTS